MVVVLDSITAARPALVGRGRPRRALPKTVASGRLPLSGRPRYKPRPTMLVQRASRLEALEMAHDLPSSPMLGAAQAHERETSVIAQSTQISKSHASANRHWPGWGQYFLSAS